MALVQRINNFMKQRPLLVSLLGNTAKTACADVVTQLVIEEKSEVDMKRLGVFTTFGFVYLGGWQYYLFNKVFVRCEKCMTVLKYSRPAKASTLTFMDLAVHTPFMYFPSFYALKGYVQGDKISNSYEKYKTNLLADVKSMWQVWLPAQMINFGYIPIHLRMPFITFVSFAWTIILSMQRGN